MSEAKARNPLRTIVNILSPIPLAVVVWAYFTNHLTVNPIQTATQRLGDIAIVFLLLCLLCSPLNTLFDLPKVLKLRRPLGLWSFYYATMHLLNNVGLDYGFNFKFFAMDNGNKIYIYIGMLAILSLAALAFTSRKWWKVRLGKRWKKLHKLVYVAGGLAVLHLALVIKGNVLLLMGDLWKPLSAGIVLTLALVLRIPPVKAWVIARRQTLRARLAIHRQLPPRTDNPLAGDPRVQPGVKKENSLPKVMLKGE